MEMKECGQFTMFKFKDKENTILKLTKEDVCKISLKEFGKGSCSTLVITHYFNIVKAKVLELSGHLKQKTTLYYKDYELAKQERDAFSQWFF